MLLPNLKEFLKNIQWFRSYRPRPGQPFGRKSTPWTTGHVNNFDVKYGWGAGCIRKTAEFNSEYNSEKIIEKCYVVSELFRFGRLRTGSRLLSTCKNIKIYFLHFPKLFYVFRVKIWCCFRIWKNFWKISNGSGVTGPGRNSHLAVKVPLGNFSMRITFSQNIIRKCNFTENCRI